MDSRCSCLTGGLKIIRRNEIHDINNLEGTRDSMFNVLIVDFIVLFIFSTSLQRVRLGRRPCGVCWFQDLCWRMTDKWCLRIRVALMLNVSLVVICVGVSS